MFSLFFLDLAFLEIILNLLLQHGQRCKGYEFTSMKTPHTEHGLCPATNLNPPDGLFAANLLQIPLHLKNYHLPFDTYKNTHNFVWI
jgi:hypothetical protein